MLGLLAGGATVAPAPTMPPEEQPTCEEVAAAYPRYQRITDKAVFVNPELAMLCRGASQQEVEAARGQHGPHANTAVLIYMNDAAAEAFRAKATLYPAGSVIVKRKQVLGFRDQAGEWVNDRDNGVGGMIKRAAGYDPAHGDWEYFYFDRPSGAFTAGTATFKATPPAKLESGRIASCVGCHAAAARTDRVFGTWVDPGNPLGAPTGLKLR